MTNRDDNKRENASFSLQNEIKKRKTQEIQRAVENKKIEQAHGDDPRRASQSIPSIPSPDPRRASQSMPSPTLDPRRASQSIQSPVSDPRRASQSIQPLSSPTADPRRASQSIPAANTDPRRASQTIQPIAPDARRTSQTMSAAGADARRTSQSMNSVAGAPRASQTIELPPILKKGFSTKQKQMIIATFAGLGILLVCSLLALFAFNQQPASAVGLITVPTKTADSVLQRLKDVGVPVTNVRVLTPEAPWSADELIELEVKRGGEKGRFLLLSYSSPDKAQGDTFYVRDSARFKDWSAITMSNVNVLISPDTPPTLRGEISSHLFQFIIAPSKPDFFPQATATPDPNATQEATAAK